MDFYLFFKFVHVAAAIVWIGAGVGLLAIGIAAERAADKDQFGRLIANMLFLAPRAFVPASGLTLVTGLVAAWFGAMYHELWAILGLVGFALTFATGQFVMKPRADMIAALIASEGYSDEVMRRGSDLLMIARFDYVMLFTVVAVMVYKPTRANGAELAVFAIVLVIAAAAFLRRPLMGGGQPAQA